jgi:hypothetical protein
MKRIAIQFCILPLWSTQGRVRLGFPGWCKSARCQEPDTVLSEESSGSSIQDTYDCWLDLKLHLQSQLDTSVVRGC